MSYYTTAIAVGAEGNDPEAQAKLIALNREHQAALVKVVKEFPTSFTAVKAADMLDKAAQYGQVKLAQLRDPFILTLLPGATTNVNRLQAAVNVADEEQKKWRAKIPYIGDGYVYRKGANKEWGEVNKQVLTLYNEIASLIGEHVSLDQSRRELKKEIIDTTHDWGKYALIAGGVLGGTFLLSKLFK